MSYQNFLDISEFNKEQLMEMLNLAIAIKKKCKNKQATLLLENQHLAMIFEKPSTRTRVSFEVGINQLGGKAVVMDAAGSQIGRGETIADTARVLARYVDLIMIRCFEHNTLLEMSEYAGIPVINGLTNFSHPCQIMTDILTIIEHRGSIEDQVISWIGDGNNMTTSWIHAAAKFGFTLKIATPKELEPNAEVIKWAKDNGANIILSNDAKQAAQDADVINADCWVSMGDEDAELRMKWLQPFQIDDALMSLAKDDAIFMHCLPAHRGEEVTESVIDGKQSIIFDEAENRLHMQKAIMAWCQGIREV